MLTAAGQPALSTAKVIDCPLHHPTFLAGTPIVISLSTSEVAVVKLGNVDQTSFFIIRKFKKLRSSNAENLNNKPT